MTFARTRNTVTARINAAFQQIAAVIRTETHNDASLFGMLAGVIHHNPVLAAVLANNIEFAMNSVVDAEIDYTEILIEAYRLSLFARVDGAQFYDAFEGRAEDAEQFAINFKALAVHGIASTFMPASNSAH